MQLPRPTPESKPVLCSNDVFNLTSSDSPPVPPVHFLVPWNNFNDTESSKGSYVPPRE